MKAMDREMLRQIERVCIALDIMEQDTIEKDPFSVYKSEEEQMKDAQQLIEEVQKLRFMHTDRLRKDRLSKMGLRGKARRLTPHVDGLGGVIETKTGRIEVDREAVTVPPKDMAEWLKESIKEDFEESMREAGAARSEFSGDWDD